jgi:hypothetical protein
MLGDDDDRFILRPAPGALQRVVARYGLVVEKSLPARNIYLVKPLDDDNLEDNVRGDRDVVAIERNLKVYAPEIESGSASTNEQPLERALFGRRMVDHFGSPAWESFVRQPAASLIGLPAAHNRALRGAGMVAIIDTGVDASHPLLRGALASGYDFTREQEGIPSDLADIDAATSAALSQSTTAFIDNGARPVPINSYTWAALTQSTTAFIDTGKLPSGFGHGTMVASLVRLVAPGATILPIKAFLSDGSSNTFDILRAIYFATDRGARVINMSFNFPESSPELLRAITFAANRRVVLVASAGNSGNEILVYPAAYPQAMGIAATTLNDERAGFTNYGASLVTLAAPGDGVIVAYPGNNYASAWGTSFSTPLVSAAVALILERNPSATPVQVENQLKSRAKPLEPGLGAGRLFVGNL